MPTGRAIEIVSVDPNTDSYDSDSDEEESDDDDDDDDEDDGCEDDGDEHKLLDFERQSQCSNATFRTRTDSSSIGDYESHTSDYEDTDDDDSDDQEETAINKITINSVNSFPLTTPNVDSSILDLQASLVATDDLLFQPAFHKNRTLSTNTVNSDVDGLLQIDANTFDLAEFITKDDFKLLNNATVPHPVQRVATVNSISKFEKIVEKPASVVEDIKLKKKHPATDSDSDSDVIVDVETVEVDEDAVCPLRKASESLKPSTAQLMPKEEESPFVDNIKSDPSWSPVSNAKKADSIKIEVNIL